MLASRPPVTPPDEKHGHVAVGREQNVARLGHQRGAHRDGLLPASYIHAAQDLTLAIELALDAVFHLPHKRHVIQALMRQFGRAHQGIPRQCKCMGVV